MQKLQDVLGYTCMTFSFSETKNNKGTLSQEMLVLLSAYIYVYFRGSRGREQSKERRKDEQHVMKSLHLGKMKFKKPKQRGVTLNKKVHP